MVLLPGMLRIPLKYEREFLDAWESRDYKRILTLFENHSLNGGDGPGYKGYLIYSIYEINLVITRYKLLIDNLNLYGKEYLKKHKIKNIRSLRRLFVRMLSIREQRFMAKYGINEEWLMVKILGRSPNMKLENYYYKVLIDDIGSAIKEGVKRNNVSRLKEGLRNSIRLGIELSLILGWFMFLTIYSLKLVERLLDKDMIIDIYYDGRYGESSVKLLFQISSYFTVHISWLLRFFPHTLHLHSINSYGTVKRGKNSIMWLGVVERCWSFIFILHLDRAGLVEDGSIDSMCKICIMGWEALYKYISNNFSKVDISNGIKDKFTCIININAYYEVDRTEVKEVEEPAKSSSD